MNKYSIAFDVGGLFIRSAVLDDSGEVVPGSYAVYPSKAKESKQAIIEHFVFIIKQQTNGILDREFEIEGVGYAFPGPFDYENGISYIKGFDKFEHIYGENLRELILNRLQGEDSIRSKISEQFVILFENNASLFALGEYASGAASSYYKSIFVTIGAGTGSAFMENGCLIKDRADVPQHGWIYNEPYKETIVDDYISKRGILRLARRLGIISLDDEVETLAVMARSGDARAKMVFQVLGSDIAQVLNRYTARFKPDAIIIRGQITKSKDLFLEYVLEALEDKQIQVVCSEDTSLSTFQGVANLLKQYHEKRD